MRLRAVLASVTVAVASGGMSAALAVDIPVGCDMTRADDLASAFSTALVAGPNSITLAPGCDYVLSGDSPHSAPDLSPTILAPMIGVADVTINGNGATIERDMATAPARFFFVGVDATLRLHWVTLRNGVSRGADGQDSQAGGIAGAGGLYSGLGGALLVDGTIEVDGVTFDGNQAIGGNGGSGSNGSAGGAGGGGLGGAIFSRGNLAVTRSLFAGNSAGGGGNGGLRGCVDEACTSAAGGGGGAGGNGGTHTPVDNPPTSGSYAGGGGGFPFGTGPAASGGFAGGGGGGFFSGGFAGEFGGDGAVYGFSGGGGAGLGGAIFVESNAASISNSTFHANMALGGGTHNDGGNAGSAAGGAIFLHTGTLELQYDTFVANAASGGSVDSPANPQNGGSGIGGGVFVYSFATLDMDHTIAGDGAVTAGTSTNGSSGAADDSDLSGVVASLGYNLVRSRGNSTGYVMEDLADGTDPLLGVLADNRGPTLTFLPQAASPLIDADATGGCADAVGSGDARGDARPYGSGCDIGAVEVDDTIFRSGLDPPFD